MNVRIDLRGMNSAPGEEGTKESRQPAPGEIKPGGTSEDKDGLSIHTRLRSKLRRIFRGGCRNDEGIFHRVCNRRGGGEGVSLAPR